MAGILTNINGENRLVVYEIILTFSFVVVFFVRGRNLHEFLGAPAVEELVLRPK